MRQVTFAASVHLILLKTCPGYHGDARCASELD
jgi:hypothetical protein